METNLIYLNGKILPEHEGCIGVHDAGFLHGASAFTTMRVHNGRVFRLARHLARLMETVERLNLRTDATAESLTVAAGQLLAAGGVTEARMRITLTPGSTLAFPGSDVPPQPTTLIATEPLAPYLDQWRAQGIGVVVSSYRQIAGDIAFGNKTGCYLPRILARQEAAAKGCEEALWFTTENYLAEACFRNLFLVLGGKVYTPPLDTPVLPGIVREAVIEMCPALGLECDDRSRLTVREMLAAEEIFLTGSGLGVCPVVRVERHAVGGEKPGPVTKKIADAYERLLETECPLA